MRTHFWVFGFLFVVQVSVVIQPVECFFSIIPISVPTAFTVITTLMKLKAIIVKVLLGLKMMGVEGFIWRKKRSISSSYANIRNHDTLREELLQVWGTLEQAVNKSVGFDVDACIKSSMNTKFRRKSLLLPPIRENNVFKFHGEKKFIEWISQALGTIVRQPIACRVLKKELNHINKYKSISKNQFS